MDSMAITMAILTHPIQVLLMAMVAGHLVRMAFAGRPRGPKARPARRPIASPVRSQAA